MPIKNKPVLLLLMCVACTGQPVLKQDRKQAVLLPDKDWIQKQVNNYKSAYQLYDSASTINPSSASAFLRQSHAYLDAVLQYEKEITAAKDSAFSKLLLKALYYKGTDLCDVDSFSQAGNLLNNYLVIFGEMHLPPSAQSAYVHKTIGDIYTRLGDELKAIFHKRQSLQFYEATNDYVSIASETINISIAFREKKLYDSAINYLKKGTTLPAVKANRLLTMYTELAKNYLAKNDTLSASMALQKGDIYFNLLKGSKDDLAKYDEKNLDRLSDYKSAMADLLMHQNKMRAVLPLLKESLSFYQAQYGNTQKREIGKTYNELGKTYLLLHQKDSAIYCFNRALYAVMAIDTNDIFAVPDKGQVYAENTAIEALEQKAEWMLACADSANTKRYLDCAINCYDLIMDVEYKLLQYFSYDDSKLSMLKESRSRSERAIGACYKLYSTDKNGAWIEKAFRFAERNKSFILLESVKRNLAIYSLAETDSTYRQLQQAQLNYANCEKGLIEAKNSRDTTLIGLASGNLKIADDALQLLKSRSRYSHDSYKALLEKEDTISLFYAAKFLTAKHSALLEYFVGDSSSYCFYIAEGENAVMYKLSDTLLRPVNVLLEFFRSKNNIIDNPIAYSNAAYQLYVHLALNKTGKQVSRLIIIPDDRLSFIPFDALVMQPGNSFNLSSFNYLIKRYEISCGYSVTMLLKQLRYKSENNNIAVFAPVFAQNERNLSTLQFSPGETESIQQNYREGKYFRNNKATLREFKNNAPSSGIIHIASHASATGVPRIEFYDSTLYVGELYAMQLHANLVVLSGCETGIGKIEKSEGAISLARGFYYAGAHNIITSLWNVDDNSTARLFGYFYGMAGKKNYGMALHQAKLSYLTSAINNDKYSPYYWAGFVYIGVENMEADNLFYTYVLVIGATLALFFIVKIFLKKRAGL